MDYDMDCDKALLAARVEKALSLGQAAGGVCLDYFRQDFVVRKKADNSPVTVADEQVEEFLHKQLRASFPRDAIIGEEGSRDAVGEKFTWTIDPIDGTESFVEGRPFFSILLGLLWRGEPVFAVANFPALGEIIYGIKGQGAWRKQHRHFIPCQSSSHGQMAQALACHAQVSAFQRIGMESILRRLENCQAKLKNCGDSYGAMMVATGQAEVYLEPQVGIWDIVPIQLIVQQAGGDFFDFEGRQDIYSRSIVACNGPLAKPLRQLLCCAKVDKITTNKTL